MAAPRKKREKNRKTKFILEFDEDARGSYLKGFQKRKAERKQAAKEKRDQLIKEERKALRQQMREIKKNNASKGDMVIPEIEQLVEPEVYDLPEHTVTIANIGEVDFVGKTGVRLGQNTGESSSSENEENDRENAEDDRENDDKDGSESDQPKKKKDASSENKSLIRKLASCSNQLSAQQEKSRKNNRRRYIKDKLQAKRVKKKKNKSRKPKKR